MAINVSTAPFCNSGGVVSYQRNGTRSMLPHLLRTSRVKPQPHLAGAFSRDQQHSALSLYRMPQKGLPGRKRRREIKQDKSFAGAPLSRQQAMADRRYQLFDQP